MKASALMFFDDDHDRTTRSRRGLPGLVDTAVALLQVADLSLLLRFRDGAIIAAHDDRTHQAQTRCRDASLMTSDQSTEVSNG